MIYTSYMIFFYSFGGLFLPLPYFYVSHLFHSKPENPQKILRGLWQPIVFYEDFFVGFRRTGARSTTSCGGPM